MQARDAGTLPGPSADAVLFDMDGTLSETEAFWQEDGERIADEHGTGSVGGGHTEQGGASMDSGAAFLREHHGVQLSVTEIRRLTVEHVLRLIGEGFTWRPGARELLAGAKAATTDGLRSPRRAPEVSTSPRSARARPAGGCVAEVLRFNVAWVLGNNGWRWLGRARGCPFSG